MPYVEGPRHGVVTAQNHGAVLSIVTWVLMTIMVCAALLKFAVRSIARGLGGDDVLVSVALLFGIGEVIALSLGVNHGLGKRSNLLDDGQISSVLKSVYASSLLYILTLAFAKISIIWLMTRLFVEKKYVRLNYILGGIVLAWAISAFFAAAFQCGASAPWNTRSDQCFNINVFWYIIGAIDIILDLALIIIPTLIVRGLQMDVFRKLIVLSAFWLRIFVIGACITRLALLSQLTFPTPAGGDPTFPIAFWIATMAQTAFAVVASCAPALKPFMGSASSGLLGVSLNNREGTYNVSGSYAMQNLSKQNGSNGTPNGTGRNNSGVNGRDFSVNRSSHKATVSSKRDKRTQGSRGGDADFEEEPDNVSERFMIRKTTGYQVSYSEDAQGRAVSQPRPSVEEMNGVHQGV